MSLVARGLYCHSRGCGISIILKGVCRWSIWSDKRGVCMYVCMSVYICLISQKELKGMVSINNLIIRKKY